MNQLEQVFRYQDKQVRTAIKDGNPWFAAKDVCDILEIGNAAQAVARLEEDEKGLISNDTPGGVQEVLHVNEAGLYSLILGSRKPEAKAFKRWITHEVIPAIRKTGSYNTQPVCMEDMLIAQLQSMKEMRLRVESTESKVEQLANKVEKRMTEEVEYQLVTPSQLGKMFEPALSAKAVNSMLRDKGMQWRVGGEWLATADGKHYSSSEPVQLASGKIVYQLKWQRRVVDMLNAKNKPVLA